MALSRETRIIILLVIDIIFFLVELIVGYIVGSLALIADSYHLLNDILSLVISLYAIKLAARHPNSRYSYGWHRAGILAALINGVFLLALSFSIFLSAIERFAKPEAISDPRLVVIVGCIGLVFNVFGLFLFHEHGHGHSHHHTHDHPTAKGTETTDTERGDVPQLPEIAHVIPERQSPQLRKSESLHSLFGHPLQTRAAFVQAAQNAGLRRDSISRSVDIAPEIAPADLGSHSHHSHDAHDHNLEAGQKKSEHMGHGHGHRGHSHVNLNMRGLLLHVFGDALGNIGVIVSGLIIWLTTHEWRYHFDPICSIIITLIIFWSAVPLVRSTSSILIQGVPSHIDLDQVRAAIISIQGILSLHEFHVWQLSEEKIVASIHILVSKNIEYMTIAREVRAVLHSFGIHSGTIQPEFIEGNQNDIDTKCLIPCSPKEVCNPDYACCPPPPFSSAVDEEPVIVESPPQDSLNDQVTRNRSTLSPPYEPVVHV